MSKGGGIDYICITDIARQKNWMDPNGVIANWIRNRNTIEFLGIWETRYYPDFNPLEFDVHPKSWTVNNRYLHVLSSVLHRTQSV